MNNRLLVFLAIAVLIAPLGSQAADPPVGHVGEMPAIPAADPSAPVVTEANILASERFWPYSVDLTKAWKSQTGVAVPAKSRGVLIRVAEGGRARIDFGRNGIGDGVPIGVTDLVAQANRIRTGEQAKTRPNFVEAIGPRLLSSGADKLVPVPYEAVFRPIGFLCVFADPEAAGFPAIAKALAPLQHRADVMTILFPQGRLMDVSVYEKLRSLGWKVPFVFEHLSGPYKRTLVADDQALPYVMLQTREGRVIQANTWSDSAQADLARAIDGTFGPATGESAKREDLAKKP